MTSGMKRMAVAVLFVGLTGCHLFGKKKPEPAQTPPPPRPVAEVKPPPPKVEQPGPPPKIESKEPDVPPAVDVIPTPPAPKPRRHRDPKKPTTAPPQTQPKEGEGENTTTPAVSPVPKLGEILSEDQRVQYLKICDESLGRAKAALTELRGYTLNAAQKQSVGRIKTFINQAEQARQRDPQTARQLAERADLLSRDLVKTVR